jgi:signal recognition particle receptor subunit beta
MGHCGSGKTHFINKMCNANLPMGVTGSSYTRDIDYLSCAYFPQNQFLLYDSPGTNSK